VNTHILFRKGLEEEGEFAIALAVFGDRLLEFRSQVPAGVIVAGRYSVLPYYKELEEELKLKGSRLINSHAHHKYIAQMGWLEDIGDLTPRTYEQWGNLPAGSYVVKGVTNSRKFQWHTHMFAETREQVPKVVRRLLDDTLVREQGLVVREYVPLKKLGEQINGLPVTMEYRFFCLGDRILTSGFYWSNFIDELDVSIEPPSEATRLVRKVLDRIPSMFVVVDVAQTESEDWIVVELNDGQMSGLSCCRAEDLYRGLKRETL
jgi:hypothetical protein